MNPANILSSPPVHCNSLTDQRLTDVRKVLGTTPVRNSEIFLVKLNVSCLLLLSYRKTYLFWVILITARTAPTIWPTPKRWDFSLQYSLNKEGKFVGFGTCPRIYPWCFFFYIELFKSLRCKGDEKWMRLRINCHAPATRMWLVQWFTR